MGTRELDYDYGKITKDELPEDWGGGEEGEGDELVEYD